MIVVESAGVAAPTLTDDESTLAFRLGMIGPVDLADLGELFAPVVMGVTRGVRLSVVTTTSGIQRAGAWVPAYDTVALVLRTGVMAPVDLAALRLRLVGLRLECHRRYGGTSDP